LVRRHPHEVRKYCRPESVIEPEVRIKAKRYFSDNLRQNRQKGQSLLSQPSLFAADNVEAEPYAYNEHFRNQLKAKLLPTKLPPRLYERTRSAISAYVEILGESSQRNYSNLR
jgi:hypothetical protein